MSNDIQTQFLRIWTAQVEFIEAYSYNFIALEVGTVSRKKCMPKGICMLFNPGHR